MIPLIELLDDDTIIELHTFNRILIMEPNRGIS
jgi:hypothetical protein